MREVKHYFVGTLGISDYYSASLYEQQVMELLEHEFQTHDYALLSGGKFGAESSRSSQSLSRSTSPCGVFPN